MSDFNWQATSESRRYGLITEEERYQAYKERMMKESETSLTQEQKIGMGWHDAQCLARKQMGHPYCSCQGRGISTGTLTD